MEAPRWVLRGQRLWSWALLLLLRSRVLWFKMCEVFLHRPIQAPGISLHHSFRCIHESWSQISLQNQKSKADHLTLVSPVSCGWFILKSCGSADLQYLTVQIHTYFLVNWSFRGSLLSRQQSHTVIAHLYFSILMCRTILFPSTSMHTWQRITPMPSRASHPTLECLESPSPIKRTRSLSSWM